MNLAANCTHITENVTLPQEETTELIIQSNACLWTGLYKIPDPESLTSVIRLDFVELKGIDGKNFVAIGEGVDTQNASSVLFNHSNIHFGFDFFLERLNIRSDSFWIQIFQIRVPILVCVNVSLTEEGMYTHFQLILWKIIA